MLGWLGMPVGRLIQAIVGIALLWIGMAQVTVFGLVVMLTGLIAIVAAAAPPRALVPVGVSRLSRQRHDIPAHRARP
jgi:hypothetical protein